VNIVRGAAGDGRLRSTPSNRLEMISRFRLRYRRKSKLAGSRLRNLQRKTAVPLSNPAALISAPNNKGTQNSALPAFYSLQSLKNCLNWTNHIILSRTLWSRSLGHSKEAKERDNSDMKRSRPLRVAIACCIVLANTLPVPSPLSVLAPSPVLAKDAGVKVGDKAPEFSLPDQDGNMVSLKDFAGKKSVILYFYPKDDVGVCKKEACLFRDQYQAFVDAGAEVLGVSADSVASHKHFESKRHLPFKLLSDKHGKVRKLYEVPRSAAGLLSGRVTFVIDREGIVRLSFNSLMNAEKHVSEALSVLKESGSR